MGYLSSSSRYLVLGDSIHDLDMAAPLFIEKERTERQKEKR